jgi:predicted ATPase/DNA-binding winged helix-turn-helix (wHTH) protein
MAGLGVSDAIHRFGAFELFPRRQLLIHAGIPVTIGSRALAILSHLVEHAGSLVSRDALLAAAWPNIFVHPGNLKVNVASLRRVLTAHDPRQDYIVSIPGRGYRFVAPVRHETAARAVYTSAVRCTSLPAAIPLVGRSTAIDAICDALEARGFVTVTGTGGVGKTAVVLSGANRVASRFAYGACFVDLASVLDDRHLAATISAEFGVRSDSDDLLGAVIHALRDQHRLLILDNCEHLLPAIAAAAERLAAALPAVTILATSREPLRLGREHVFRLAPLSYPSDAGGMLPAEDPLGFAAVELFTRRAREATGTEVALADLAAVAKICKRLDGIPLALELAAARCAAHAPTELLSLLENRLDLPGQTDGMRPARQRTLRATLAWSYGLLRPQEAAVFVTLAVFAGPFTIPDALALTQATEVAPVEALESIASLIGKSLLAPDGREDGTGFRFLESTRAFASELLRTDPRCRCVQQRHAEHVIWSLDQALWRQQGAIEDARADTKRWAVDLRRALDWAFGETGSIPIGVSLVRAAIPLWERLSLIEESIVYLTMAIAHCHDGGLEDLKAEIQLQTALATALFHARGLTPSTDAALRRALTLGERLDEPEHLMDALWGSAVCALHAGSPSLTVDLLRRFDTLGRTLADPSMLPDGDRLLAAAEMYLGRLASAAERLERVLSAWDRVGGSSGRLMFQLHRRPAASATCALVQWLMGDRVGAAHHAERTVHEAAAAGHPVTLCNAIIQHALLIALFDERLDDAQRYLVLLREQFADGGLRWWAQIARCPEAALAMRRGEPCSLERLQSAIVDVTESGTGLRIPAYLGILAEGLAKRDRLADADGTIADALARATHQQELWIVPELLRIQADLRARQGHAAQAEQILETAVAIADGMGALSWHARASADLTRLRHVHGSPDFFGTEHRRPSTAN